MIAIAISLTLGYLLLQRLHSVGAGYSEVHDLGSMSRW
jgi:hypothetical protein